MNDKKFKEVPLKYPVRHVGIPYQTNEFRLADPEHRFQGLPLLTEMDVDGNEWRLVRSISYKTKAGDVIIVPEGFVFDFASIPSMFQWLYPKTGCAGSPYGIAALIHDWLYCHRKIENVAINRKQADNMFYEVARYCGCSWWTSSRMYRWIRIAGWIVWGQRKPEDIIP